MSGSIPFNEDIPQDLNLQQELQSLIDECADWFREQPQHDDPFEETYQQLAAAIVTASRMYIGLRRLEDYITSELDNATQDS